eukprot:998316_1
MKQSHKRFWSAIITVLALSEFVFSAQETEETEGENVLPDYESTEKRLVLDGVLICSHDGENGYSEIHCTDETEFSVSCQVFNGISWMIDIDDVEGTTIW